MDHLDNREQNEGIKAGIPVILPSSFIGSPRNMQERYQDAMSIVRKFGKPDIFLTVTCNPQSPSIKENLDGRISSRFSSKSLQLGYDKEKPRDEEIIDKMVWAEIPDEESYPELNAMVLRHMIYGPCSDTSRRYPCIGEEEKCTKGYPKKFRDKTKANENGYPMYQRRNTGKKIQVKSVKYLYKYIHKGFDCAPIEVQARDGTRLIKIDEVKSFVDARYVSTPEARLNGYEMFMKSHTVIRLAVHLPNRQMIYVKEGNEEQAAISAQRRDTTLTAWFLTLNVSTPRRCLLTAGSSMDNVGPPPTEQLLAPDGSQLPLTVPDPRLIAYWNAAGQRWIDAVGQDRRT
ncbi:uncharacterized protein LOC112452643 [Temnothorax curvispinosus]|uniref:Uncharacterized protein LOC112452643 n=1 Tax=Temnothorax curvispinosus TaxID=300111 RepID=A0A6J1PHK1_9HYME|nr:uncharacterized protein LOC112452643 [Temnothorax curvispinosus]